MVMSENNVEIGLDWKTALSIQQQDFIERLNIKSNQYNSNPRYNILLCKKKNVHSELAQIQGNQLKKIRDYCWGIAQRFVPNNPQANLKEIFEKNFKGKLAEAVVCQRLEDLVEGVDYEIKTKGGDGKVDLRLKNAPQLAIAIKSNNNPILTRVKWRVSQEEIEKNKILVFVWIKEEINVSQGEFHLYFAGFYPTYLVNSDKPLVEFSFKDLLYNGGLRGYIYHLLKEENKKIQGYLKQGKDAFNKANYLAALEAYNSVLEINPKHKLAYQKRARLYLTMEHYEEAIKDYSQALSFNSKSAYNYHYRGIARYCIGDYEKGIEDATKALQINDKLPDTYFNRGQCFLGLGEIEKAIDDYNKTLELKSEQIKVYAARGYSYFKLGKQEEALTDYNRAIELDPQFAIAYYYRGLVYKDLGKDEEAIKDYTQAIDYKFNQADVYFHRGKILDKMGKTLAAIDDYDVSIRINPHYAPAYCSRGLAKNKIGNPIGALKDYTQAIDLQPDYTQAYYRRGAMRNFQGDQQGAIEDYTQTIELDSSYGLAYYNRGEIYHSLGNLPQAIADFQQAQILFKERNNEVYAQMSWKKIQEITLNNEELKGNNE
jgi:tetratricopeptide (TPR) repeat protein